MAPKAAARARARRPGRPRSRARSTSLTGAARKKSIIDRLREHYGGERTALRYKNPFQLLLAVILSAQSTDTQVNMVTPALFRDHPTPESIAKLTPRRLEPYIKTVGLYHSKAKNIVAACRMLVERYGGQVPPTMDELLALPGVGRKTANVVLSVAFGADAMAVDTHVFRVANRLGLARAKNREQTEQQLMQVIPRPDWSRAHHWLIWHGRRICHARSPECARCFLADLCPSAKKFL